MPAKLTGPVAGRSLAPLVGSAAPASRAAQGLQGGRIVTALPFLIHGVYRTRPRDGLT